MKQLKFLMLLLGLSQLPWPSYAWKKWEEFHYTGDYYYCLVERGTPEQEGDDGLKQTTCTSDFPNKAKSFYEICSWTGPQGTPKCEMRFD